MKTNKTKEKKNKEQYTHTTINNMKTKTMTRLQDD